MIEHVTDLLGAYLDGELQGLRLRQVEEHLEKCAACRKELVEMRHLSELLQESYPVESFMPADRFAANMVLRLSGQEESRRLPRQAGAAPSRKPLDFIWWLVPVGMLGAWVFVQAVFTVSSLVSTADLAGLFGNTSAWLQSGSEQSLWFTASMSLFGNQIQGNSRAILNLLNNFSVFGAGLAVQLLIQAGIALVYWIWLGLWWKRRQATAAQPLSALPLHS
jgi:hypothetical protein